MGLYFGLFKSPVLLEIGLKGSVFIKIKPNNYQDAKKERQIKGWDLGIISQFVKLERAIVFWPCQN